MPTEGVKYSNNSEEVEVSPEAESQPEVAEEPEPEVNQIEESATATTSTNKVVVKVSKSDATQTENGDVVDGSLLVSSLKLNHNNNGPSQPDGGFLSNFFTLVLPLKRKTDFDEDSSSKNSDSRNMATQTEEQDPIIARGLQLSQMLISELSLQGSIPDEFKDDVYESLAACICDMLVKHSILFNGMVHRCQVTHYHVFTCIANEIFEAAGTVNESAQLKITWGRIISLFAFAVRLAQEYREDLEQVDSVIQFLATYVTKHLVPYVRTNGGWEGLVEQFPPPVAEDAQVKRAILWSGLCVGLMATMYVSSFLSTR